MVANFQKPIVRKISFLLFKRYVWLLSGSKKSFYVYEKDHEQCFLSCFLKRHD